MAQPPRATEPSLHLMVSSPRWAGLGTGRRRRPAVRNLGEPAGASLHKMMPFCKSLHLSISSPLLRVIKNHKIFSEDDLRCVKAENSGIRLAPVLA
jgi:hypothetical protein